MNRKTFFSGVATGVAASVMSFAILNMAAVAIDAKDPQNFSMDEKINYISQLLNKHYVDNVDNDALMDGMYYGMVDSIGDPYTTYLSSEQVKSFMESTEGSFCGIGVNIISDEKTGTITVISPIAGTPAETAGILPGDVIRKVNGTSIIGMDSSEAISMIKGAEGTEVKITVYRQSEDKEIDLNITRSAIEVPSVAGEMLADDIAYIKLSGFKNNTYDQFIEEYNKMMSSGAKGLVLDVRNNPGGVLSIVEKIADKLVPEGTLVYTIDKNGERVDYTSDSECVKVPLCILVNGNSASASEILAGAVQDTGTGTLVGTQTFGKGLVQNIYPVPDGSAVKVTIQKYYTPRGVCIQGEGIAPDYVVNLPEELEKTLVIKHEDDTQLQKAIDVVKGEK
jgi:C-terminal peptidase (prc)